MKTVNIVGGGISGLTAGVFLLKSGFNVNIYEKNNVAGGFCTSWQRGGVIIDGCLHWLIGTHSNSGLGRIWREIGGIKDGDIVKLDSFFKVFYNNETLTFYNDFDKLECELNRVCVCDKDKEEVARFMDVLRYLGMFEIPSDIPPELIIEQPKPDFAFARKTISFMTRTLGDYAQRFETPIIRYALEHAPVNKRFCVLYFAETLSNLCSGNADLPRGGSSVAIRNVTERFKALGGKLITGAPVSEIIIEDGIAKGIKLESGQTVYGDYTVAACDIHHTYEKLLGNKYAPNAFFDDNSDKEKYSTYSYIIAAFKTNMDLHSRDVAEIYHTEKFDLSGKECDVLSVRHYAYDESLTNDGYTVLQVFVDTDAADYQRISGMSRSEYAEFKRRTGETLKCQLEKYYGVNGDVELIDVITPRTYERYLNSYQGSFMTFPLGAKMAQPLYARRVDGIDKLYLANQWLMAPGGTPIAVMSGKFAAQLIAADAEGVI
ncbi:MAG: NAD(P)/FAD-dependent oxidoreductase [Clostridiales bacterium]|nr:NAD(P)/FAD-dependent oxidoreductase [Clostridiales bacterium]